MPNHLVSGVVRSDLIVCARVWPDVAPACLERGPRPRRRGHSSPWVRPNTSRSQVFRVAPHRSPALLCHRPRAGTTLVRGTFLANRRPAVETRVHQSGGPPTHAAPAHRADPRARPPPATGPWIDHHQHHQGGAYRTAFTVTAAPTSEGWCDPAPQRSDRKAARMSVEKSSGSSQAAKWPPLSTSWK